MNDLIGQLKAMMGQRAASDQTRVAMPKRHPAIKAAGPDGPVEQATEMIAAYEKFRPTAYRDPGGVPTIGYGMTQGVRMGDTIDEPAAMDSMLAHIRRDSADFSRRERGRFGAVPPELLSASYNLGVGGVLDKAEMRGPLLRRDYNAAADLLMQADKQDGKTLRGLTKRRAEEAAMLRERGAPRPNIPALLTGR